MKRYINSPGRAVCQRLCKLLFLFSGFSFIDGACITAAQLLKSHHFYLKYLLWGFVISISKLEDFPLNSSGYLLFLEWPMTLFKSEIVERVEFSFEYKIFNKIKSKFWHSVKTPKCFSELEFVWFSTHVILLFVFRTTQWWFLSGSRERWHGNGEAASVARSFSRCPWGSLQCNNPSLYYLL